MCIRDRSIATLLCLRKSRKRFRCSKMAAAPPRRRRVKRRRGRKETRKKSVIGIGEGGEVLLRRVALETAVMKVRRGIEAVIDVVAGSIEGRDLDRTHHPQRRSQITTVALPCCKIIERTTKGRLLHQISSNLRAIWAPICLSMAID